MEKSYEDVWNGQEDGAPMARIKDVAREAGVAASTVSLVLNQKGYVSEATRQKVEAAMKKLNYIPSEVARNLSLSRTQTIGVILPSLSHPFFGELAEELEAALYHLDYKMMICCTHAKENSERDFVDMLRRRTMDGIIMGAQPITAVRQPIRQLARLAAEKIVRRVKGEMDDLPCTCEPELIERETC